MRKSPPRKPAPRRAQEGVMLLEALVAILIFTLGIIAVLGMQSASILQVSQAKYRTDASYLANQIIGKMWGDRGNLDAYTTAGASVRSSWDDVVAATLPNGSATIARTPNTGLVTVTVQWRAPDETNNHRYVAAANIRSTLDP
jgi:type IV pilus assembly protein PilV